MTDAEFKNNFNLVQSKKTFFFTATPKDIADLEEGEESDLFLMNNEKFFGKRIGPTFKESVDGGYIVQPIIHWAKPSNYDPIKKFGSIENYTLFVKETFLEHEKWLKSISCNPKIISAKMLVKCPSVDIMWAINRRLVVDEELKDVHIFAGASRNDGGLNHQHNGNTVENRDAFLKGIKDMKSYEKSIILHFDILSEGINVPGITGVFFAVEKLPTKTKILQNTGRSTRLFDEDRKNLKTNSISTTDHSNWVKPYCAVILPIIDSGEEVVVREIAKLLKDMRDNYSFNPAFTGHSWK